LDVALSSFVFFAVPACAVRDHEAQNDAWVWYSDTIVPVEQGAFTVRDDGRLEFEARNDD
jgi:hypothetical protein